MQLKPDLVTASIATGRHTNQHPSRYALQRTSMRGIRAMSAGAQTSFPPTSYIEIRSGKMHSRRADRITNAFTRTIVGARMPRLGRFLHETRARLREAPEVLRVTPRFPLTGSRY